jgi:hypothetical protein
MFAPLAMAKSADETLDELMTLNTEGIALFTEQDGEYFVNGRIVHNLYTSLSIMGATGQQFGTAELSNLAFLMAAIESRSRGERLYDEMVAGIKDGTLPDPDKF